MPIVRVKLFAALLNVNRVEEINSAVRGWSFITNKTIEWKIGHEWIKPPGTFDFTQQTLIEQATYQIPSTDNRVPLTEIYKNMLRPNMAVYRS